MPRPYKINPDEVKRLYVEERLPIREIAKRLNVSKSGVEHRLKCVGGVAS